MSLERGLVSDLRQIHWDRVYSTQDESAVSWFQGKPTKSLELISACKPSHASAIIDIGCGVSRLVDELLALGFETVNLLDVSENALDLVRHRLDRRASKVVFHNCDIAQWVPDSRFNIWHDRAVLHFLVDEEDRNAYREKLDFALKPGGFFIVGSFAIDGPEKCSGLPVQRYSAYSLQQFLGNEFELLDDAREEHLTPSGKKQAFQFCRFIRR